MGQERDLIALIDKNVLRISKISGKIVKYNNLTKDFDTVHIWFYLFRSKILSSYGLGSIVLLLFLLLFTLIIRFYVWIFILSVFSDIRSWFFKGLFSSLLSSWVLVLSLFWLLGGSWIGLLVVLGWCVLLWLVGLWWFRCRISCLLLRFYRSRCDLRYGLFLSFRRLRLSCLSLCFLSFWFCFLRFVGLNRSRLYKLMLLFNLFSWLSFLRLRFRFFIFRLFSFLLFRLTLLRCFSFFLSGSLLNNFFLFLWIFCRFIFFFCLFRGFCFCLFRGFCFCLFGRFFSFFWFLFCWFNSFLCGLYLLLLFNLFFGWLYSLLHCLLCLLFFSLFFFFFFFIFLLLFFSLSFLLFWVILFVFLGWLLRFAAFRFWLSFCLALSIWSRWSRGFFHGLLSFNLRCWSACCLYFGRIIFFCWWFPFLSFSFNFFFFCLGGLSFLDLLIFLCFLLFNLFLLFGLSLLFLFTLLSLFVIFSFLLLFFLFFSFLFNFRQNSNFLWFFNFG